MKITTRNYDDVHIFNLNGYIDASNAHLLEEEFDKIVSQGHYKFVVNLKEVDYISSAGLRVFLSTIKSVKAQNGDLKLCEMNTTVNKILDMAGFSQIFDVCSTESESLANFSAHTMS